MLKRKEAIYFKLGSDLTEDMTFHSRSGYWKKPALLEIRNVGGGH